jgi:hypothetical protein
MPQLEIRTKFDDGLGTIEMRPMPDALSRDLIKNAHLHGVDSQIEVNEGHKEGLGLGFSHTTAEHLDHEATVLSEVLRQAGVDVTLNGPPSERRLSQSVSPGTTSRFGRLIPRLRPGSKRQ